MGACCTKAHSTEAIQDHEDLPEPPTPASDTQAPRAAFPSDNEFVTFAPMPTDDNTIPLRDDLASSNPLQLPSNQHHRQNERVAGGGVSPSSVPGRARGDRLSSSSSKSSSLAAFAGGSATSNQFMHRRMSSSSGAPLGSAADKDMFVPVQLPNLTPPSSLDSIYDTIAVEPQQQHQASDFGAMSTSTGRISRRAARFEALRMNISGRAGSSESGGAGGVRGAAFSGSAMYDGRVEFGSSSRAGPQHKPLPLEAVMSLDSGALTLEQRQQIEAEFAQEAELSDKTHHEHSMNSVKNLVETDVIDPRARMMGQYYGISELELREAQTRAQPADDEWAQYLATIMATPQPMMGHSLGSSVAVRVTPTQFLARSQALPL